MLKGNSLSKNSTIGIIAPASSENNFRINKFIDKFTQTTEFKIVKGIHIYDKYGTFCGTPQNRANDLLSMFADKSIDGIICLRGGFGSSMIIPYLDEHIIKANPKFFCGFSDITSLLNYFCYLDMISFHGPMINSNWQDTETLKNFINISTSNNHFSYDLNQYSGISYINGKSFSGKLIGGNLTTICSNIGTYYSLQLKPNNILILEDINEPPYVISRMLYQLRQNNFFKNCQAIIIGYFSDVINYNNSKEKLVIEKTIINSLNDLNIPIILGFPFGHNYPNLTLPLNCTCNFNFNSKQLKFTQNFLN